MWNARIGLYETHTNECFLDTMRCCAGTHPRKTCTIVKMLVKILFNTHVGHFKMVVTIILYYFTSALHFDAPCVCVVCVFVILII